MFANRIRVRANKAFVDSIGRIVFVFYNISRSPCTKTGGWEKQTTGQGKNFAHANLVTHAILGSLAYRFTEE